LLETAAAAALLFFMLLLLLMLPDSLPTELVSPTVEGAAAFELASFLSFRFAARILPILMGFLATTTAALAGFSLEFPIGAPPLLLFTIATVRRLDIFTHYCSLVFVYFL
jgi:hypothetical protein